MKRVMCGKMTMAYQNVQLGKSSGNVVYRVRGPKGGQQGSEGSLSPSPRPTSYMVPAGTTSGETDSTAAWNILALSMFIRSQSPDSSANNCFAAPLPPSSNSASIPSSLDTSLDGVADSKFSSSSSLSSISCCSSASSSSGSSLYSLQSSQGEEGAPLTDLEFRHGNNSLDFTDVGGTNVGSGPSGPFVKFSSQPSSEYCFTDSGSDEDRFSPPESTITSTKSAMWSPNTNPDYLNYVYAEYSKSHPSPPGPASERSESSSSIGAFDGSSFSSGDGSGPAHPGDMEVDSKPSGGFDDEHQRSGGLQSLGLLGDSLPAKRGLSKFYNGRAQSFSSFADLSSVEELAKPDDYYAMRRRKSASSNRCKAGGAPKCRLSTTSGISKRSATSSGKSGLAMAVAMGTQELQELSASPPKESQRSLMFSGAKSFGYPATLESKLLKSLKVTTDVAQLAVKHG